MAVVTNTATSIASGTGSCTSARPRGASAMSVPLMSAGVLRMAEM